MRRTPPRKQRRVDRQPSCPDGAADSGGESSPENLGDADCGRNGGRNGPHTLEGVMTVPNANVAFAMLDPRAKEELIGVSNNTVVLTSVFSGALATRIRHDDEHGRD